MKHQIVSALSRHPATFITVTIGLVVFGTGVLQHLDLVQTVTDSLSMIERETLDEVVLPAFLICLGVLTDRVRSRRKAIQAERLRILKATMRTVQDIVNNALGSFQLLRLDAEENSVTSESLRFFDEGMREITQSIQLLGNVNSVRESQLAAGSGIHYEKPTDAIRVH